MLDGIVVFYCFSDCVSNLYLFSAFQDSKSICLILTVHQIYILKCFYITMGNTSFHLLFASLMITFFESYKNLDTI